MSVRIVTDSGCDLSPEVSAALGIAQRLAQFWMRENRMQVRQFTTDDSAYKDSVELRERYLRAPLGLSLADEDLSEENIQLHFGLFEGDRLLGSVTFKIVNESLLKLRQMVIDENAQGSGLGTMLINGSEEAVRELGYHAVEMAARLAVKGFYEKLGYVAQGDVFVEVKIEHIKMVKCDI